MSDHTMCPGCHQLRYWTDFDARCSQCRQPTPSSGEEAESSPQCRCSMLSWSPLCERHGWLALIRRIQALEAGPPGLAGPPSSRQRVTCPYCLTVFEQVSIPVGPPDSGPPSPPSSSANPTAETTP